MRVAAHPIWYEAYADLACERRSCRYSRCDRQKRGWILGSTRGPSGKIYDRGKIRFLEVKFKQLRHADLPGMTRVYRKQIERHEAIPAMPITHRVLKHLCTKNIRGLPFKHCVRRIVWKRIRWPSLGRQSSEATNSPEPIAFTKQTRWT